MGGSLNGVPNKIETFEPTIRRSLVPHLMPDPLLRIESRLIRRQVPETKARMCSYKTINLFPLMPSGPIYIQPYREASQMATKMLQTGQESFSVSMRPSDHPPSAQQRSHPSKQIQTLAMLARRRNPQPASSLCPSYPQTRVQGKPRFVFKNDGFFRSQRLDFFLRFVQIPWPLHFVLGGKCTQRVSSDTPIGASKTEPDEPLTLSRSVFSGERPRSDRPTEPDLVQILMETFPSVLPILGEPSGLNGRDVLAFLPVLKTLIPARPLCASKDSSSVALIPRLRQSIPDVDPPVSTAKPQFLFQLRHPEFVEPWRLNAPDLLRDALPLKLGFS